MKTAKYILLGAVLLLLSACDKVSPIGVLVSGTGVEDRVKMSNAYYQDHKGEGSMLAGYDGDEYTFLVGADSHLTTDDGRMREMLQIALDNNDLLMAHLGDIADTKAEYYITLEDLIDEYRWKYARKNFVEHFKGNEEDYEYLKDLPDYYVYEDTVYHKDYLLNQVKYPFYPVVGNHDITHNGWALWSNIFHSSFYDVYVLVNLYPPQLDHFIFLDSASGTLGREQVKLLEQGVLNDYHHETGERIIRHTFVFSHTNIFRPRSVEFASTFPREEMFFLLNKFTEWETDMVFLGHVHKWDYQKVGNTEYLTLDSMCEANNPNPGDYLVRVHVKKDGTISWEKVRMNYTKK